MSALTDFLSLGDRIVSDFSAGRYASLSRDIGDGFARLGDVLETFFGLQASDTPDADGASVAAFLARGRACCRVESGLGAVAGFDPSRYLAALTLLLDTLETLWKLFNKPATE